MAKRDNQTDTRTKADVAYENKLTANSIQTQNMNGGVDNAMKPVGGSVVSGDIAGTRGSQDSLAASKLGLRASKS